MGKEIKFLSILDGTHVNKSFLNLNRKLGFVGNHCYGDEKILLCEFLSNTQV